MKMAGAVQSEFGRFIRRTRRLRQILKDTLRTFDEIRTAGNFEDDAVSFPQMNEDEVTAVENIVDKPPSIVILGHNNAAKAAVTNAIFQQNILPTVPDYEPNIDCGQSLNGTKWRSILFTYSNHTSISLSLPGSFELVEDPEAYDKPWKTIPLSDLAVLSTTDDVQLAAMLDVHFKCSLLKDGGHVIVSTSRQDRTLLQMYKACAETVNPVPVYPVSGSSLTEQEVKQLQELKEEFPHLALFFIKVPRHSGTQTTQLRANHLHREDVINQSVDNDSSMLEYSNNEFFDSPMVPSSQTQEEDRSIVIHNENTQNSDSKRHSRIETTNGNGEFPDSFTLLRQLVDLGFVNFVPSPENTHRHSVSSDTYQVESELIESLQNLKQLGIFTRSVSRGVLLGAANVLNLSHKRCLQSFIMKAFDMTRDIMITPKRIEFAREKESELYRTLIEMSMSKQDEIRELITETICGHRVELLEKAANYEFLGVDIPETKVVSSAKDLKICTGQIQELVLGYLNTAIAAQILSSLNILKETYTGTLTRCLESLEQAENLESTKTSSALQEILNAAYQVDITVRTGSSFVRVLMEKMRQLIYSMPWKPQPRVTAEWKQAVASNIMKSLSAPKLSKSVCNQIKERLKNSHETFTAALKQLEERHSGRLVKMEEQRLRVKKYHAPKVARLALESMSIRDRILYGIPKIAREVGRGQYGVVYACDSWAGCSPCAVKSVVPPDDKHWNDLALEFYYTKLLPEHDRVVSLRGSVIDYSYGESSSQVLLIMDRLQRDLYSALKSGIEWITSLQIAIDVVEGIRFLHNQGLVHRDIKLKNVLLDKENRAKITDLGFCKPEAMMSGSIVGTPIHMAPELFTGNYDNSVDVFAFGVLFWYLCAGHVRLPFTYEQCRSKDMLWDSVKRGVRPERLPQFTDECWTLMQACWSGDPEQRPLLGMVEPQLLDMFKRYSDGGSSSHHKGEKTRSTVGR